jgi:hypothetical protein
MGAVYVREKGQSEWAYLNRTALFMSSSKAVREPEKKDCILALDATHLEVSWKDFNIEYLAYFRSFLLKDFGSYNHAWEFLTRKLELGRTLFMRNLTEMFEGTRQEMKALQDAELNAAQAKSKTKSEDRRMVKDILGTAERRKMRANTSYLCGAPGTEKKVGDDGDSFASDIVEEHLEQFEHKYGSFQAFAHRIASLLDADDGGTISVFEVEALYDEVPEESDDLDAFRMFLHAHPRYQDLANFWADLTKGMHIERAQFMEAITAPPRRPWHLLQYSSFIVRQQGIKTGYLQHPSCVRFVFSSLTEQMG